MFHLKWGFVILYTILFGVWNGLTSYEHTQDEFFSTLHAFVSWVLAYPSLKKLFLE